MREKLKLDLKLRGLYSSTKYLFNKDGLELVDGEEAGRALSAGSSYQDSLELKEKIKKGTVVIDLTAADITHLHLLTLAASGIVITANKKPLADKIDYYWKLHANLKQYFYETTVGSSTPVIQTLQDLVETGDEIFEIKAVLSGTLGFICSELCKGDKFSNVVKRAKALGYTDPHPRDDLLGLDAARKALILGREVGLPLEMEDVKLEGLIPGALAEIDDVPTFLSELKKLDDHFASRLSEWQAKEEVPQFVASITPAGIKVGLVGVNKNEPLGRLNGPENFFSFRTRIFQEAPLIIQGKGAGAQYTAEGVLQDIIRASENI